MGYAIKILRFTSDLTTEEIIQRDENYELDEVSEKVDHLYMSYNHREAFKKLDIYPRSFNYKEVREVLPYYIKALEKIKEQEGIEDEEEFCISDYFEQSPVVVYEIIKEVIKSLRYCEGDEIWISD